MDKTILMELLEEMLDANSDYAFMVGMGVKLNEPSHEFVKRLEVAEKNLVVASGKFYKVMDSLGFDNDGKLRL